MRDDADVTPRRRPIGLRPHATLLGGALLAGALVLAGCGGGSGSPGVASAGTPTTSKSSASGSSAKASPLAFSQCMRAHGIPDFPDPNGNGQLLFQGGGSGSDLNPSSPQFQAAQNDCKSLAPGGPTARTGRKNRANALKFSECMRKHGITNFPDPNSQGGIELQGGAGGSLDPKSPQFQSAQSACFHYLGFKGGPPKQVTGGPPGGSGGASTSSGASS
jgi:hypothetical protein